MSADAVTTAGSAPEVGHPRQALRLALSSFDRFDRFNLALALVVVAQALYLGILMGRGWYYQADLANLVYATGKPLAWSYLSAPQGGHFGGLTRIVFWFLNRAAPLNYTLTVLFRLAGQALATVLLVRLLVLLVGRRPIVLVTVLLYAFSPLLIQGTLWLTAALGLLGSQILLLIALTSHVRYAVTRSPRHAVIVAACAMVATLLTEQAAVTLLILPVLSLGFLSTGTLKQRMRETLSLWPEWALVAGPMIGYVLFYFLGGGGYGTAAHRLGIGSAVRVVGVEWSNTIGPGLVGGPWSWFGSGDNYLGLSTPTVTVQAMAGVGVLLIVLSGWRSQGWRALAAWSMPALVSAIGIVIVAIGRYHVFGIVIAQQFEHGYFAALPAALAACLAFCRVDLEALRAGDSRPHHRVRASGRLGHSRRPVAVAAVATAILISSLVSGVTYTQLWAKSPTRDYMSTLASSLRSAGRPVALYDSRAPAALFPLSHVFVSDLIHLAGVRADFGYTAPRPGLVDGRGHVVAARFYVQTDVDLTGPQFCRFPVQGKNVVTKPFRAAQRANDWYVQISYFQQHASVIRASVIDGNGDERLPVSGKNAVLERGAAGIHLMFRGSAPAAIRVESSSPATNLCITSVKLGFPFAGPKKAS